MKIIKYLSLIFFLFFLAMVSCQEDPLEEKIVSEVTAEYYESPEGLESAVNAAYEPLRNYYGAQQGMYMTIMGTDEFTHGGHGGYHYMDKYTLGLNSEGNPFWHNWSNFYEAINTCNTVISRGEGVEMSQEKRNSLLSEVHFLRAHYYFLLVRFFGPVHLTLDETVGVEIEAERTPEDQIYEAIESDLEFAIDHLPASPEEFGRATEPAAKHMLALVLLTRGYQDYAKSDDFERAASLASSVINDYDHSLLETTKKVFDHDNEQNAEVLWSVQYSQDPLVNGPGNRSHVMFRPWYEVFNTGLDRSLEPGYGRPWIRFRPTQWLLDNFRPLDVDARYSQMFQDVWYFNTETGLPEGAEIGDTAIWVTSEKLTEQKVERIKDRNPGINLFTWHQDHYYDINDEDPTTFEDSLYYPINMFPSNTKTDDFKRPSVNYMAGSRDVIVYRLAETYLVAAEALYQDGSPEDAVDMINEIRRRAAFEGKEDQMEITSAELDLDFILDERARELYGEQKRWLDLKRTGKLLERVKAYNDEGAPNIEEYHRLRPIPAQQRERTSGGYPQNDGY